jgi:hypothetical protein
MSTAVKNLTKVTVIPRTGTFFHKTDLDIKKVRPRIIFNYQSITEVFKHIIEEYAIKAHTAVRGMYQVFLYLEVIMESVYFISHSELWGKEKNKTRTV